MITEPAKTFSRMFRGYDPAAVDAYIEVLLTKQQLLLDEVNNLRARLNESGDGAAALRIEVACLKDEVAILSDTSPSPYAMQHRMAKMLRRAVDEVSRMHAEARAEADALIAEAEAEAETTQRERRELLADMAAQRKALETKCEETSKELDFELARMRAETQSEIDDAWQAAQREREQLLAEAREQARQAVDEATQQRIMILEELMGVAHDLEGVPASLESAYQGRKNPPEASVVVPLDQKNQAPSGPAVAS
jgi:cell division septum initiation protein DivIVA